MAYPNVRRRRFNRRGRTRYASPEALQHIEEARAFTREVGGVDKDVKSYFFSLAPPELSRLLNEYGARCGREAQAYAEQAYPSWKSGRIQMSGLVAKRLFDQLPARMPLPMKYVMVKKLWDHSCPRSRKVYYIDEQADLDTLSNTISTHLERQVQDYYISNDLSNRFSWLAAGDVHVRQQLENYFQQLKKAHIGNALRERLRVIESHLGNHPEDHRIQEVRIGHHVVEIRFSQHARGVADDVAVGAIRQEIRTQEQRTEGFKNFMWFVFWVVVVVILFKACAGK